MEPRVSESSDNGDAEEFGTDFLLSLAFTLYSESDADLLRFCFLSASIYGLILEIYLSMSGILYLFLSKEAKIISDSVVLS